MAILDCESQMCRKQSQLTDSKPVSSLAGVAEQQCQKQSAPQEQHNDQPPTHQQLCATSPQTTASGMKLRDFYHDKTLFVTGISGFIGKVFLVKLLISLANVRKVFVLMRPKKGQSSSARFQQMLSREPFVHILSQFTQTERETMLAKLVVVEGDMQADQLGLSKADHEALCSQAQLLFNIAASVQFDAPIKANLRDNVFGAKNLLELALNMRQLLSLVHVSTFYTNCHLKHIDEKIHPLESGVEKLAQIIEWLPERALETSAELREAILEKRPNPYILTKAMSENLVASYDTRLPIAIVRPSIVVPSVKEPFAGWVDSINGPMGLGAVASVGLLRYVDWDYYAHSDVVPADSCVNLMLAAAERTVRLARTVDSDLKTSKLVVYNLTTGTDAPQTWGNVFEQLRNATFEAPPIKMLRIPIAVPKIRSANKFTLHMSRLSEILFAYFIDMLLVLFGQKKVLVRITTKLHKAFEILRPFMTNSWTSSTDNFRAAFAELQDDDKREFPFDMQAIDWRKFYWDGYMGARMRILREDPSNISAAKSKMRALYVIEFCFKAFLLYWLTTYAYWKLQLLVAF